MNILKTNGTITGYSLYDGYVTTFYDLSFDVTGIELDTTAAWSVEVVSDTESWYTYTDDLGDEYTYVASNGAVTGYRVNYSYSDYAYTYDSVGELISYSYSDGVTTTVYNPDGSVNGTPTVDTSQFDGLTKVYATDGTTLIGYKTEADKWGTYTIYEVSSGSASGAYKVVETFSDSDTTWVYEYSYDSSGNFAGATISDGTVTTSYDQNWELIGSAADPENLTPITDDQGQPIGYSSSDGQGNTTLYDSDGKVTGYEYEFTYADGSSYKATYDAEWNMLSSVETDKDDIEVSRSEYTYDESGNFTGYVYSDGVTTWTYGADWSLTSSKADTSGMTQIFNDSEQLIGYSSSDSYGNITFYDTEGVLDGYGYESQYSYTVDGTEVTEVYTSRYDENWNFVSSSTTIDGVLAYSETYEYNASGVFTGSTYFDGVTTYQYDQNWNLVDTSVDTSNLTPDGDGFKSTDQWGTTTYFDASGKVTGYAYESSYIYQVDGVDVTETYFSSYDANWNYIGSETYQGETLIYSDKNIYNESGEVTGYEYFDGVTTYTYDYVTGNQTTLVDTNKLTDEGEGVYSYQDDWGTTTYFDVDGKIIGYANEWYDEYAGTTYKSTYDENWMMLTSETLASDGTTVLFSEEYQYDANGNFTGYIYFDGTNTYEYDEFFNIVGTKADLASLTALEDGSYTSTNAFGSTTFYDSEGKVTGYEDRWTDDYSGHTTVSKYDANWMYLGSETTDQSGKVIYSDTYTYDSDGNFQGYEFFDGITTYKYDENWQELDSIVNTALLEDDGNGGFKFTDEWGNTTYYGADGVVTGYGNTWTSSDPWDYGYTYTYEYDENWALIKAETLNAEGDVVMRETYNEDGSREYFDGNKTETFDALGQLIGVTVDVTSLIAINDPETGNLSGYKYTDDWGRTTFYDASEPPQVTGYEESWYDEFMGTTTVSTYDENYMYLGSVTTSGDGTVLYSDTYYYNDDGSFAGYESFDGSSTYTYDENWNQTGVQVDPDSLEKVFAEDGTTVEGYRFDDGYGTITLYDANASLSGYETSWTDEFTGNTLTSTFDDEWMFLSYTEIDATGKILFSETFDPETGTRTVFDGVSTTVYDKDGNGQTNVDFDSLEEIVEDGITYYKSPENSYGDSTYYLADGSVAFYENKWIDTYSNETFFSRNDADWNYLGSTRADSEGNILSYETYQYDEFGMFAGAVVFDGVTTITYNENWEETDRLLDENALTPVYEEGNPVPVGYEFTSEWGQITLYNAEKTLVGYKDVWVDDLGFTSIFIQTADWMPLSNEYYSPEGVLLYSEKIEYGTDGNIVSRTVTEGNVTTVYDGSGSVTSETSEGYAITFDTVDGDGIVGTFKGYYGETGTLYSDSKTENANSAPTAVNRVEITGSDFDGESWTDTFTLVWSDDGSSFTAYLTETIEFSQEKGEDGNPKFAIVDGQPIPLTWSTPSDSNAGLLATASFEEYDDFTGTEQTVTVEAFSSNNTPTPDSFQLSIGDVVVEKYSVSGYDPNVGFTLTVTWSDLDDAIVTGSISEKDGKTYFNIDPGSDSGTGDTGGSGNNGGDTGGENTIILTVDTNDQDDILYTATGPFGESGEQGTLTLKGNTEPEYLTLEVGQEISNFNVELYYDGSFDAAHTFELSVTDTDLDGRSDTVSVFGEELGAIDWNETISGSLFSGTVGSLSFSDGTDNTGLRFYQYDGEGSDFVEVDLFDVTTDVNGSEVWTWTDYYEVSSRSSGVVELEAVESNYPDEVFIEGEFVLNGESPTMTIYPSVTPVLNSAPSISTSANGSIMGGVAGVVYDAAATDSDGDPLAFTIAGGADADLFAIDTSTGEVSFLTSPDYAVGGDNEYDVTIGVTDGLNFAYKDLVISVTEGSTGGDKNAPVSAPLARDIIPTENERSGTENPDTLDVSQETQVDGEAWEINGLGGDDTLVASAGDDILSGGAGADTMTGGAGDDIFYISVIDGDATPILVFNMAGDYPANGESASFDGVDIITDFSVGDEIVFEGALIQGIVGGDFDEQMDEFTVNEVEGQDALVVFSDTSDVAEYGVVLNSVDYDLLTFEANSVFMTAI